VAPTFRPGRTGKLLFNNTDLSDILTSVTVEASANAPDVTTFQDADVNRHPAGLRDGSVSYEGLFDGTALSTASTATTGALDAKFQSALGSTSHPIVTYGPENDTLGRRCRMFQQVQTAYTASSPVDDVVRVSAAGALSDRHDFGVWLHALASRSSTSSTLGNVNSGVAAGTTGGGVGHLHYTNGSLANMTVQIQHSSAASTGSTDSWANIITFSAVTESSASATAAQRSTVSGTVKRRVRAVITTFSTATGNSTTGTFAVAFARRGKIS